MSVLSTLALGGHILSAASSLLKDRPAATPASTGTFADSMSTVDKFLDYQKMTPAQKIRASYLSAHGLTEDTLKAMSPEEQQKIEKAILEEILQKLGAKGLEKGNQG